MIQAVDNLALTDRFSGDQLVNFPYKFRIISLFSAAIVGGVASGIAEHWWIAGTADTSPKPAQLEQGQSDDLIPESETETVYPVDEPRSESVGSQAAAEPDLDAEHWKKLNQQPPGAKPTAHHPAR